MIDVASLAFVIEQYVEENPDSEPSSEELATFIVSRWFEAHMGDDNPLLLQAACAIIENRLTGSRPEWIKASRDDKGIVWVELSDQDGHMFTASGRTLSAALMRLAERVAGRSY